MFGCEGGPHSTRNATAQAALTRPIILYPRVRDRRPILDYEQPPGYQRSALAVVASAAVIVVITGASVAFWILHWPYELIFWLSVLTFAIIGLPLGIRFGSQNKDFWA